MAELGAAELVELTRDLDDTKRMIFQTQFASERKDRGTAVILALLLYDRIWLGDTALGILKLVTAGGCGIWGLVDVFTAGGRCDDYNRRKALEIAQALRLSSAMPPGGFAPPAAYVPPAFQTPPGVSPASAGARCVCGAEIGPSMKFCSNCGASVQAAQGRTCPKCGTGNSAGAMFCRECGNALARS